jgi:WD40 repeat protein
MLWDAMTGEPLEPSFEGRPENRAMALHPDGRRLATAGCDWNKADWNVRVWDLGTGQPVWERKAPPEGLVPDVAYSPDGRWLALACGNPWLGSSEPGVVTLWEAGTGKEIHKSSAYQGGVFGVAFSPDSRWLASGGADGIVRIWDTRDIAGEPRELSRHGPVRRVMFLPDGRLVSAGGGLFGSELGEVKIWDLSTGHALDLRGHTSRVECLTYSPDGRRLATGSNDRTIKLWDTTTGEEVFTLRGHTAGVLCVAFSPDGRRIASGGWDRTVRVWDTSPPTAGALLRHEAESRVKVPKLPADPFAR